MKKLLFFILLFTFCFANEIYVDSNINDFLDEDGKANVIVMFKKEIQKR